MTVVAPPPPPSALVRSLAGQVRNQLCATEGYVAYLVIGDFDDALRAAADDHERIHICRVWQHWLAALRVSSRWFD